MKAIHLLLLMAATTTPAADKLEETYAQYGQVIATQFVWAPFPHPARAQGHKYKEKLYPAKEHNSDSSVRFSFRKGFAKQDRLISSFTFTAGTTALPAR